MGMFANGQKWQGSDSCPLAKLGKESVVSKSSHGEKPSAEYR